MTITLIDQGKESVVHPLLTKDPRGGWLCRCGDHVTGLVDAYQHVRDQHSGEPCADPKGDIYDARELSLDDLRAGGAL